MKGRFSAAIVAFAVATAFISVGRALPEFFVQLRDPNLLGGKDATWLLHTFGFSFVLGLCAAITAAALLLAAWRTRLRGASDWHVGLAATFIALCLVGRIGVSLDPVAWFCIAAICLLLDRDGRHEELEIEVGHSHEHGFQSLLDSNAQVLADAGAAQVAREDNLTQPMMTAALQALLTNPRRLARMAAAAANSNRTGNWRRIDPESSAASGGGSKSSRTMTSAKRNPAYAIR